MFYGNNNAFVLNKFQQHQQNANDVVLFVEWGGWPGGICLSRTESDKVDLKSCLSNIKVNNRQTCSNYNR